MACVCLIWGAAEEGTYASGCSVVVGVSDVSFPISVERRDCIVMYECLQSQ